MSQKSQKRKYRQKKQNKTCRINYIPASDKDIKAIIDVNAIKHNINFLRKKTGTDLMPVLKADAYGHGLVEMSKILRKLGIKYIGVATLGEAILLRESGDKGRVLSWLYDIDGDEFKHGLKLDLDIAVFDEKLLPKSLSSRAESFIPIPFFKDFLSFLFIFKESSVKIF